MKENNNILNTAYISLFVQLLIGLIGIHGIFIPLEEKDAILTDILILETTVQFIELSFYIWLTIQLSRMDFEVTYTRYFDWFISTPIMLLTTIFFMEYMTTKEDEEKIVTIYSILNEDLYTVLKIVFANFLMLLFGFLAEIKIISRVIGFLFGTSAFAYSFYLIYDEFVGDNIINKGLFYFMFIVWGLYGVAFLFPYISKNIYYNFLDIISKNFYGLFLYYIILKTSNYM